MSCTTGARSSGGTSLRCSMYAVAGQLDAITCTPWSGTHTAKIPHQCAPRIVVIWLSLWQACRWGMPATLKSLYH